MRTLIARSLLAGAALCVSVGLSAAQPQPTAPPPQRPAVLAFIREHNPALADRVEAALRDNPQAGDRIIGRLEPQVREIMAERDPETRELRLAEMKNGFETLGAMRQFRDSVREGKPSP